MICSNCGDRIRISDPEHFAWSRSPFVDHSHALCDGCAEDELVRDTIVDLECRPDALPPVLFDACLRAVEAGGGA